MLEFGTPPPARDQNVAVAALASGTIVRATFIVVYEMKPVRPGAVLEAAKGNPPIVALAPFAVDGYVNANIAITRLPNLKYTPLGPTSARPAPLASVGVHEPLGATDESLIALLAALSSNSIWSALTGDALTG